jgi:hypothetical protein
MNIDIYRRTLRAKGQIVKALRTKFPATKFQVSATANCVQAARDNKGLIFVNWADGPKENEIEALAKPFANDIELVAMPRETCPHCGTPNGHRNTKGLWCGNCNGTSP